MVNFQNIKSLLSNSQFYYVVAIGMDGRYIYVSKNYQKTFFHVTSEFVGKITEIDMHPEDFELCKEIGMRCLMEPGRLFPITLRKHDGKGGYVITQWELKAMLDEGGNPIGIFGVGYDISRYMDELDRKNSVLKDIAWTQSHVIRQPLANILGLVSIIDKTEMDENTRHLFDMLLQSAMQLDNIVRAIVHQSNSHTVTGNG